MIALLAAAALASPFSAEHALSREARGQLAAGAPEAALGAWERLERELGPRAEIDLGRGAALLRLGLALEAGEAFERARSAPEPLGSRALLGLGDARAAAGDTEGAIAAFRASLARDPDHADARHNLEVLLRRRSESGAPRPEPDRAPAPGAGPRAGRGPAPSPEGGAEREEGRPGGDRPAGSPAGGEPGQRAPREAEGGGSPPGGRLTREEAERLLDAVRAREQALPAAKTRPREGRRDAARDW